MTNVSKLTDKKLKALLTTGGRKGAKSDFFKILKNGAKPIDTKR